MQIKVVNLPSDPPFSPSPDPTDQPNPFEGYSLRFQHFLFILIIVFLVFISCDYAWRKLIIKYTDYPHITTTSSSPSRIRGASGSSMNLGIIGRASPLIYAPSFQRALPLPLPPPPSPPVDAGGSDGGGNHSGRGVGEPSMCSECVICLKGFRYSDLCRVLPECNHTFHAPCIDGWIVIKRSCPICRSSIQPF